MLQGSIRARMDSLTIDLQMEDGKWHAQLGSDPVELSFQGKPGLGFIQVPIGIRGLLDGAGAHAVLHIREVSLPAGLHGSFGTQWAARWLARKMKDYGIQADSIGNTVHLPDTLFSGDTFSLSWRGKSPTEAWLERFSDYARTDAGQTEVNERFPRFMERFGDMLGEARQKAFDLYGAFCDPQVSAAYRIAIAAGLIYLIMPADAVPDWLGPAGLADDIAVLHWVYGQVNQLLKTRREG